MHIRRFSVYNKHGFCIVSYLKILINIALLFSFSFGSKISGTVSDQKTGGPLIGANVYLVDYETENATSFGSASDVDGAYTIFDVPM